MDSMTEKGKRVYEAARHAGANLLAALAPSTALYDAARAHLDTPAPQEKREYQIGIIGEQSAGKSTFLNGICGYPILPTASVITSACAVEIRKSSSDYIQVLLDRDGDEICVDLNHLEFDEHFVFRLLEYALNCFRNDVITCENLNYLTTRRLRLPDGTKATLEMRDFDLFSPGNFRQVWMLLMILLGSYVGDPKRCDESAVRERIKQMRRSLLAELGIDSESQYRIRLFWNSENLRGDTVIMDLPGLRDAAGRATITQRYMDQVDCVVVLFNPDPHENDLYQFLCSFLQLEHAKLTSSSSGRVIALMNKADTCTGDILAKLQQIRKKCAIAPGQPIYPICAMGGEFAYVQQGGIDIRSTLVYKQMLLDTPDGDAAFAALRQAFDRAYRFREGDSGLITLSQVNDKITAGCSDRLRCLSQLIAANQILDGFTMIRSELTLRRTLLTFLRKSSRPITKQLNEALTGTCTLAMRAFTQEFQDTAAKVAERMKSHERIDAAKALYRQELDRLEWDIDRTVESQVRKMKRSFSKIKLSKESNQKIFDELVAWLSGEQTADGSRLVISDYLKKGNTKLELALGYQKLKYAEGIADLAKCYRRFPAIFAQVWEETYGHVRANLLDGKTDLSEEDLAVYDEQACSLKESACEFISRMVESRIDLLRSDHTMEAEFAVTSDALRSYMDELERFYYRECPQMLRQCRKEYLLSKNLYLTPKELKALFKDKSYAAQAKQVFIDELDHLLTTDSAQSRPVRSGPIPVRLALVIFSELYRRLRKNRGHQERVLEALTKLSRKFHAGTDQDLRQFSGHIKKEIRSLMDSGKSTYNLEKQVLDAHIAQLHAAIAQLRSEIGSELHALSQTDDLGSDAQYILSKLTKL